MNKTKHFKRTAFNLSAKSMVSTLLLLIAMLMPQGAWAIDFISDIKYAIHDKQETAYGYLSGYTIIKKELNNNPNKSGERWVYIGYKTDTDPSKAITDIMVVSGESYQSGHLETDNGGNNYVTFANDTRKWYRCPSQGQDGSADLNAKNGGDYLALYYTRDGNTTDGKSAITSLDVADGTGLSGWTYAKLFKNSSITANGNTNEGTNGTPTYITYTTHTHAYTAAFSWATNGKTCTATVSCSCGDTHSNLACTVTSAPKSGAAATCTAMGWTTYTAKVTSNGKDFSATKDVQDIAALGHNYGNGSWSWGNDGHSATCTRTCSNDANHKSSVSVTLGKGIASTQQVAPKCTEMGTTRYTATATVEGTQYSATKDVVDIAALGHSYGAGAWSWEDHGHIATCTRTCVRTGCTTNTTGHTSSKSVTWGNGIASAQQVAPKCTEMGTTRYTATATVEGTQYTSTKDVDDIAALGHGTNNTNYTPTYTWGGNYAAATCSFTLKCNQCNSNVMSQDLTPTIVQAKHDDATCTDKNGNETWTVPAVSYSKAGDATYNGTAQTQDYTIPAGHIFDADDPGQTYCTRCTHTFFRYTATEKVEPIRPAELKNSKDEGIYDKEKHTFADGKGVMEFDEPLVTIGTSVFWGCKVFTGDLIIPNTVTSIGNEAFYYCNSFNGTLTIPNSVTSIGRSAFYYCSRFKGNLIIPNSVTSIGDKAFAYCSGFTGNLSIPNTITSIGSSVFEECSGLTGNLTIPNTVTNIGDHAFSRCLGLTGTLTIPNTVTSIGERAFAYCSFTGLTIPNTITSIRNGTFACCKGLTGTLTIPNSVTSIENNAFYECEGFTGTLTIPNTVTSIGLGAFAYCSGFTGTLTIPNSVTNIESEAFSGCSGFTGVEFQSVPQIGGSYTFYRVNCTKAVVLSDDSYVYKESNPDFPAVASVIAPCTLDLTGSVVENHPNLTHTGGSKIVDAAEPATCGKDGLTEGSHCNLCGKPLVAQTIIPATGLHNYTNHTFTPIEDGLYAYACDNGCGTHTDDHIIKDFYGAGNHLELTKDGEGNYSTSEDIIINDPASFYSSVDFSSPVDFTAARVTFNRYIINDGGMWSFIVPFDIPAGQAAELGKFYQYSKHEEGKVYFDDITKIDNADGIVRANTAYFFKPATEFTSITVDDAEIKATTSMPDATNPSEPGLYGTYSQIDIPVGAYGYAMHDGQSTFVKAGTGNLLRSFRAYLWLGSGASMANARAFFGDYDVDAIELIGADDLDLNAPIYNLQGQRIVTPKKGEIYIQNGKKVIKK